jgi:hypothetical protein
MAYTFSAPYLATDCIHAVCGETIAAGQLVVINSSKLAMLANAALADSYPAVGIAEIDGNATDGTDIAIITRCMEVKGATGLTAGATVWAGETDGTVTTTRPSTHLDIAQAVGIALTSTTFMLTVSPNYEQIGITS